MILVTDAIYTYVTNAIDHPVEVTFLGQIEVSQYENSIEYLEKRYAFKTTNQHYQKYGEAIHLIITSTEVYHEIFEDDNLPTWT